MREKESQSEGEGMPRQGGRARYGKCICRRRGNEDGEGSEELSRHEGEG